MSEISYESIKVTLDNPIIDKPISDLKYKGSVFSEESLNFSNIEKENGNIYHIIEKSYDVVWTGDKWCRLN